MQTDDWIDRLDQKIATLTQERDAAIARAEKAEAALSEAASEINCAGPVAHRIRIMRQEHQIALEKAEAALRERALDTEDLDWAEDNLDDVTVTRDVKRGVNWEITYCSNESGCQIETKRKTLRAAIRAARSGK
jgi:hypothetical protein